MHKWKHNVTSILYGYQSLENCEVIQVSYFIQMHMCFIITLIWNHRARLPARCAAVRVVRAAAPRRHV